VFFCVVTIEPLLVELVHELFDDVSSDQADVTPADGNGPGVDEFDEGLRAWEVTMRCLGHEVSFP